MLLGEDKLTLIWCSPFKWLNLTQRSTETTPLHRTGREVHYPPQLDVKDPFILLVHQGMVEDVFLEDLQSRGVEVERRSRFLEYKTSVSDGTLIATCQNTTTDSRTSFRTRYLVGCDGSHSNVRRSIPGAQMIGENSNSRWGVLDGVVLQIVPQWNGIADKEYRSYRNRFSRSLEQDCDPVRQRRNAALYTTRAEHDKALY